MRIAPPTAETALLGAVNAPLFASGAADGGIVLSRARFYILGCFVIFCIMQSAMWNFYSPITTSLKAVYEWSDDFIEFLGNLANITFCVLVIPFSACVDLFGMRKSVLVTIVALNLNAGLRLLPLATVHAGGYRAASMASMFFNGVAGTVESLAPPVLSFLWFPVNERATATAVMASANTGGTAVGFLTALVVPDTGASAILAALSDVYWLYFIACAATLVCVVVYFPDQPPSPPSTSHSVPKVAVLDGMRQLVWHGRFWMVVGAQAVPLGVLAAWMNVLNINLSHFNISQTSVGWIGFSVAMGGTVGGVISGRVCDLFPGRMARLLSCLYFMSTALVALFILTLQGYLPYSLALINALAAALGFCMFGAYPVFFELAVETTFPISDSATAAFLVAVQAVVQSVFLAIPVDLVGTAWMNWTLLVSPFVFACVLWSFREDYVRMNMDLHGGDAWAAGGGAGGDSGLISSIG
jgi:FLVCR family MFS transporter